MKPSPYKISFQFKALLWESNHPFIAPPTCKANPIAILLRAHFAIYAPPPTPLLYAIHHTILAMAVLCFKAKMKQSKAQELVPPRLIARQDHCTD